MYIHVHVHVCTVISGYICKKLWFNHCFDELHWALYVVLCCMYTGSIMLVFIIVTTFLLVYYDIVFTCRIIRLTSPNLNYFIIGGAIILYSIPYITLQQTFSESVSLFACVVSCYTQVCMYFLPVNIASLQNTVHM